MWRKRIFSFAWYRGDDIGPMERGKCTPNTLLGSSVNYIYINMYQSGSTVEKIKSFKENGV